VIIQEDPKSGFNSFSEKTETLHLDEWVLKEYYSVRFRRSLRGLCELVVEIVLQLS
jgi:hypothetical protein